MEVTSVFITDEYKGKAKNFAFGGAVLVELDPQTHLLIRVVYFRAVLSLMHGPLL
jgi:hypothetical protein